MEASTFTSLPRARSDLRKPWASPAMTDWPQSRRHPTARHLLTFAKHLPHFFQENTAYKPWQVESSDSFLSPGAPPTALSAGVILLTFTFLLFSFLMHQKYNLIQGMQIRKVLLSHCTPCGCSA